MTNPAIAPPKRSVWPYAIVTVFVLFAAYIGSMVYQAMQTDVNLVSADYYQQELAHQQRMDAVARTAALPTPVQVHHEAASRRLMLQLPAALAGQAVQGQVHFFRPSNQALDFALPLQTAADLRQFINTSKMAPGFWRVQLDFTTGGQAYFLEQDLTLN
ncbi:FixH family protein [Hymenobacter elongatus]|uniref:Nitrogen fixation protein FixH n=1 Tax=Hymenobacter elongatus TaxID=877208 RepID=A0A4Z0PM96_9BACT|nr:FixH family protein [Hymenobacter elongatus]TGE17378.1 nitrogen fixation protein FixH [Hymenobacter elongatus]